MLSRIKKRLTDNNKGSVLVLTVIFSMATITIGAAYLQYVDHQRAIFADRLAAYQDHGAAYGIMVQGMVEHPTPGQIETSWRTYYDDGCTHIDVMYFSKLGQSNSNGYTSSRNYKMYGVARITSCAFPGTMYDTVSHDMSSHSYADYLYLTDKETQSYRPHNGDDTLRFWGPDTLDGKVHSNDMLHFQQGNGFWPVFWQEVTSCSTRFSPPYAANPGYVAFLGGFRLGVPYKPFPLQADSVRAYSNPPPFPGNGYIGVPPEEQSTKVTEIFLDVDGYCVRHRSTIGNAGLRRQLRYSADPPPTGLYDEGYLVNQPKIPYPASQALFVDGELWISAPKGLYFNCYSNNEPAVYGQGFEGVLTIGASGDIIITQDILYRSANPNGSVPESSEDVLGLISEKHVLVWRNCPSTIKIDAGIGAIGDQPSPDHIAAAACDNGSWPVDGMFGTISVDGINCYGENKEKSQLTIYGCLIMKERGLIHTSYNGGARGFVSKNYHYDRRFITDPPPHFFETIDEGNYYEETIFGLFGD